MMVKQRRKDLIDQFIEPFPVEQLGRGGEKRLPVLIEECFVRTGKSEES